MGSTTDHAGDDEIARALAVFDEHRRRIFGIGYRMLGTVADAEDIVQETWIRWQGADRAEIREPAAFLATIATRLSINATQAAHARRETYIGPWLPEPINTGADPSLGAERAEALQFAILIMLQKLTPTERAAYILREALDYPYERIAEIIGTTEGSSRQLVSRARKHLVSARRSKVVAAEHRRLLEAFLIAAQKGDVSDLEALFAEDVVSTTDGNGVKLAARKAVTGRSRVATFIAAFAHHFWIGKTIDWVELNGQPAATVSENGVVTTVALIDAGAHGIEQIHWIMSPAKLGHVTPVGA